jgi:hypothetical protein
MAECDEIGVMLSAFGDDELEPGARRQVESHLAFCTTCVTNLAGYSALRQELKKLFEIPKLEGFARSVMEKIGKLVVLAFFLLAMHGGMPRATAPTPVNVRVDSVVTISEHGFGFGLVSHSARFAGAGEAMAFPLPNGDILRVRARPVDNGMIVMHLVLIDGNRRTMTKEVTIKAGSTYLYTGRPSDNSTLMLKIMPSTFAKPTRQISERAWRKAQPTG